MTPRWPGRGRTGWLGRVTDPLGWPLPVATLVVLAVNMVLTLADRIIPLDWLSLDAVPRGLRAPGAWPRGQTPHAVDTPAQGAA